MCSSAPARPGARVPRPRRGVCEPGVAKFATQKISKNCARRTLVEIWDGAVFILFLATHTFWLPLAAEDPQQRDAALGVRWKNIVDLCCIIKSHFS